jgi:Asp-tRNA(Asn)/Glu-tRNA(Gln) amidotransferase A subunit family amidase
VDDVLALTAAQIARLVRRRQVKAVEVIDACLRRIDDVNPAVNAFVTVLHDEALLQAREADAALARGDDLGPLHGVPVAIKDLFDFKAGVRNTFGSVPLSEFVAGHTSLHVTRIERAGAIVVGKTNTPEFGHKGVTDNALVGPTRNPFDLNANAGGSSGGSAAAVAAYLVPLAQGTDGGGSVRIPAAMCSAVGFKATFGRVADSGRPNGFAASFPFQHIGPIARTVEDAALLYSVLLGPHPRDPLSLPWSDDPTAGTPHIAGLRIAYSADWGTFPVDPEVREIAAEAAMALSAADAIVEPVDISLGHSHSELTDLWLRHSGLICAGVFEAFARDGYDLLGDHRHQLNPDLVDVIERALVLSATEVRRDQVTRTDVFDGIEDVFEHFDLIATPTVAVSRVPNSSDGNTRGPSVVNGTAVNPLIGWCPTFILNLTGHPAISVPAGLTKSGMPVGLQLAGRRFHDMQVLAAAAAMEKIRPWAHLYPSNQHRPSPRRRA